MDYICTAINKGRWSKAAKEYARSEGLQIDFTNRPNENWWHGFVRSGWFGALCGRVIYRVIQLVKNPRKALKKLLERINNSGNEAEYN